MFRLPFALRSLCAGLCCLAAASAALAESKVSVRTVGTGGYFAVGRTTVLKAETQVEEAGNYQLQVLAPDPRGDLIRFRSAAKKLAAGENADLAVRFVVGQLATSLRVDLIRENKSVAHQQFTLARATVEDDSADPDAEESGSGSGEDGDSAVLLSPAIHVVLVLGEARGLSELGPTTLEEAEESGGRPTRVIRSRSAEFPTDPLALSTIRTIVIAGDFGLTDPQIDSLRRWVRSGGHLMVSTAQDIGTYRASPLGKWLQESIPVSANLSLLTELPAVESYTGNVANIPLARRRAPAVRIGKTGGVTIVRGADGPLIERVAEGFGRITFIGLDVAMGALTRWDALPIMMRQLVYDRRANKSSAESGGSIGHNGITDIATQLNAAQTNFPGISRPSSWTAMGLIIVYLLAIGPLDYLIVHRLLRRPRLTWITFPAMVVLGCTIGVVTARRANGDEVQLNQISIIDLDTSEGGSCRMRSWFSIYTPEARRSQVTAQPTDQFVKAINAAEVPSALLTWSGVPENVFGGMLRSRGVGLGGVTWDAGLNKAAGLPMPVWSATNMTVNWTTEASPPIDSQLTTTDIGLLRGSLSHNFPFPIRNWILAHNLRVYRPRDSEDVPVLPAGQPWTIDSTDVQREDLENYLTGVRRIQVKLKAGEGGQPFRQEQATYDSLSRDAGYIVRILSLHESAGGKSYTGLTNTHLSELDLSELIRINRALLIGEVDLPATALELDEKQLAPTTTKTFVRILIPVSKRSRSGRQSL